MAATHERSVLGRVHAIMDRVYSPYTGPAWQPLPFAGRSRRYLWNDAFGVCNYLSLYKAERRPELLVQASALVQDVHSELGCVRNSRRQLDGASPDAPTRGGLRIGKGDEEEDGQYFHYLTKWMFALSRLGITSGDPKYLAWAIQLAETAHRSFVVRGRDDRALRMVWKLSVDLQHVAVSSEGNLDPFDGLVTYRLLQRQSDDKSVLQKEIADMQRLVERKLSGGGFATNDALDAGEALWLAEWFPNEHWARELQRAAVRGLDAQFSAGVFERPPEYRLLFREMGAALGLQIASIGSDEQRWRTRAEALVDFWSDRVFDRDADISPLMYVAVLLPGVWDPRSQPLGSPVPSRSGLDS